MSKKIFLISSLIVLVLFVGTLVRDSVPMLSEWGRDLTTEEFTVKIPIPSRSGKDHFEYLVEQEIDTNLIARSLLHPLFCSMNEVTTDWNYCLPSIDNWPQGDVEHFDNIDDAVNNLQIGRLTYNRITEMWRDRAETVLLRISIEPDTELGIPGALTGSPISQDVRVTPEMSAELEGEAGLVVEPNEAITKAISRITPPTWQWTVLPQIEGAGQLLTLTIYVHLGESHPPISVPVPHDEIEVRVTLWQAINDLAAKIRPVWVLLLAVVPVFWSGILWLRRRRWRQSPSSPSRHRDRMQQLKGSSR